MPTRAKESPASACSAHSLSTAQLQLMFYSWPSADLVPSGTTSEGTSFHLEQRTTDSGRSHSRALWSMNALHFTDSLIIKRWMDVRNATLGQPSSSFSSEFWTLANDLWKNHDPWSQGETLEEPCCSSPAHCEAAICEFKQKKSLFSYTFSLLVLWYEV